MKLINYGLESPTCTVNLIFQDQILDIHNDWSLSAVEWKPKQDLVSVFLSPCISTDRRSLAITFSGVKSFSWITESKKDFEDSDCIFDLSKVVPGEFKFPHKSDWQPRDEFELEFNVGSGKIRIGSETSSLLVKGGTQSATN